MKSTWLFIFVLFYFSVYNSHGQNACSSSPCRAPSECENLLLTFVCHCSPGIKGVKCDRPMQTGDSLCLSNPCWNGATCELVTNDFRCICPVGFSGKNCRTILSNPCITNNPCKNGATCQPVDINGSLQAKCVCTNDWTGSFCEQGLGLCDKPNPCFNGGTCLNNACQCPKNFTGVQCETYKPPSTDKIIKILNKGFFIAKMTVTYEEMDGLTGTKKPVTQTGSIAIGQDYAFHIPNSVNYSGDPGVILTIDVPLSFKKISTRIQANPECFHLWGIFFSPSWSRIQCW